MTTPRVLTARELLELARIYLLLVAWFVLATVVVGWWGIPIVGFVWAWWATRHSRLLIPIAPVSAAGAVVAWGALLAWSGAGGGLGRLIDALGTLTRIPGAALIVLTLAFVALLAWSAAALVGAPRQPSP